MDTREKLVDFIEDYLSENAIHKDRYGISPDRKDKKYHLSQDVCVNWIRRSSIHREWCFKTIPIDNIYKKGTCLTAFVYDVEEFPTIINTFDMINDPVHKGRIKTVNVRKKKIDNRRYFQRGSFLIEIDY